MPIHWVSPERRGKVQRLYQKKKGLFDHCACWDRIIEKNGCVVLGYTAQVNLFKKALAFEFSLREEEAFTIDSHQGEESLVVIFSVVGSQRMGSLTGLDRLLSTCSHAKDSLIISCNFDGLRYGDNQRRLHILRLVQRLFLAENAYLEWRNRQFRLHT